MPKIFICLEKYSDYLEAYSILFENQECDVVCYYIENERNTIRSITEAFSAVHFKRKITFFGCNSRNDFFKKLHLLASQKFDGDDIFAAPFVRYRQIWKLIEILPSEVTTVHLSECLTDSFGHLGYRIAYRGNSIKTWLTLPFAKYYAISHKADICYFPMFPNISNSFVKETRIAIKPNLSDNKRKLISFLTKDQKRPLLISGFGYNINKMASFLGLQKFIATSKNKEIFLDGEKIPLEQHICAEELLLCDVVSEIIGYNSTAMIWAKHLYPDMPIKCYEASGLNKTYGRLFGFFSKYSLKKIGIEMLPECKEMVD